MNDFKPHPLCMLFPPITHSEFEELKADIQAHGLRQPIVIHEGMILDGGNRYRACVEIGVEPTTVEFAGGDLVSFVLSSNLHRRHMSAGQCAMVVASAHDWAKSQAHGGDRKSDQSAILHLDSAVDRAASSGASLRTQKMADKVAKESPELAKKVAHRKVSLPKAIKQIAHAAAEVEPEPEAPAGECGPSAEELAYQEECEKARQNAYDALIEASQADDKLAEALKLVADQAREIGRLNALVRCLEESRDGKMNEINEHIRSIKLLRRELEKVRRKPGKIETVDAGAPA
jgi:hypothetical protein